MRYRILLLIAVEFVSCTYLPPPFSKENYDPLPLTSAYYFLLVLVPEQKKKEQCSQPNAIDYSPGYYGMVYCISNKVNTGLIFDATTNQAITVDTVSPGPSFFCQCGNTFSGNYWLRGNKAEDIPPAGAPTSILMLNSPYNGQTANIPVVYQTNYKQPDNLYCVTNCSGLQYQFLKIR